MKAHIETGMICGLLALVVSNGCSNGASDAESVMASRSKHIIKARSVGDYQLGQSTLEEILGSDTPESRARFTDAGLVFEFNRGKTLTGVTVTSNDYALENGLTIGSLSSDVTDKLGEPRESNIELEPKGIHLDALVYDDFVFVLDKSETVTAIRIGN